MAIDTGRLKHLELIQQTITRMATNSFLLKGWSVALLSVILIFAIREKIFEITLVALIPYAMFWVLDGFFLRQERLFRKLWDLKRNESQETPTNFSMDTSIVESEVSSLLRVCFSKTLLIFHGALFFFLFVVTLLAYCDRINPN